MEQATSRGGTWVEQATSRGATDGWGHHPKSVQGYLYSLLREWGIPIHLKAGIGDAHATHDNATPLICTELNLTHLKGPIGPCLRRNT